MAAKHALFPRSSRSRSLSLYVNIMKCPQEIFILSAFAYWKMLGISKEENLARYTQLYENFFQEISVPLRMQFSDFFGNFPLKCSDPFTSFPKFPDEQKVSNTSQTTLLVTSVMNQYSYRVRLNLLREIHKGCSSATNDY